MQSEALGHLEKILSGDSPEQRLLSLLKLKTIGEDMKTSFLDRLELPGDWELALQRAQRKLDSMAQASRDLPDTDEALPQRESDDKQLNADPVSSVECAAETTNGIEDSELPNTIASGVPPQFNTQIQSKCDSVGSDILTGVMDLYELNQKLTRMVRGLTVPVLTLSDPCDCTVCPAEWREQAVETEDSQHRGVDAGTGKVQHTMQ